MIARWEGIAGYDGLLATMRGHLRARVDSARRQLKRRHDRAAEVALMRAEAELERFVERHGNGEAA